MGPEDLLIAAGLNCGRHQFLHLKHLCDIAEIVRVYPALDWRVVSDRARSQTSANILYTALQLTQRTVGCRVPPAVWADLGVSRSRQALVGLVCRLLLALPLAATSAGLSLGGRRIPLTLLLPYATYTWPQLGRRLAHQLVG